MLGHEIWDNLDLCSWATATHIWLENKLLLVPFEVAAVFLMASA